MSHLLQEIIALGIVAVVCALYIRSRMRARRRRAGGGCGCGSQGACGRQARPPAAAGSKDR